MSLASSPENEKNFRFKLLHMAQKRRKMITSMAPSPQAQSPKACTPEPSTPASLLTTFITAHKRAMAFSPIACFVALYVPAVFLPRSVAQNVENALRLFRF